MSVALDGSTDYWRGGLSLADGKEGTLAVWFKATAIGSTQALLTIEDALSSTPSLAVTLNASSGLSLVGRNSAGTTILAAATTGVTLAAATWYLALLAWKLSTGTVYIYVNDTSRGATTTATDDTIDYSKDHTWVGAANDGADAATTLFGGSLSYVYFATTFLDISSETNRRLFYGPDGEQIGLGPSATYPLSGVQPGIFLAGGAGNFGRNIGSAGDLATFGSPAADYGRPAAVETLSRGFRGEAWRESQRSGIPFPETELVIEPASGLEVARREYSTDRDEIRRGRHYRPYGRG